MRVCICGAQVPFAHGGAERHVASLADELRRRAFEVDVVTVPFSWVPPRQVLRSAFAWRMLALQEDVTRPIDLVIATKFPSYMIQHPRKALWLIHQFRQAYDLLGTPYSDLDQTDEGRDIVRLIREMDGRAIAECRPRFANARNTADRLRRFNNLDAGVLYPPPPLDGHYESGPYGDYLLGVGRLDRLKRVDLAIRALSHTRSPVRLRIVGTGPESEDLGRLVSELGLAARVDWLGSVSDRDLLDLYAQSLGIVYVPFDEDYGYVTVEAFKSAKPVVTVADAGGVLEFVGEGQTGFVGNAEDPASLASAFDRLYEDRALTARLGAAGLQRVAAVTWDHVISSLTGVSHGGMP